MSYFVYLLQSELDGTYYKGLCSDYSKRFEEHNFGITLYSSNKRPWKLIYVEEHPSKTSALIREKKLKRCKAAYFEWLVRQPSNILNNQ